MTLTQYREIQNYFYITVQRTMGGRKKEENPKQLLSYWKEKFIKYKKAHPRQCFSHKYLKYPHRGIFYSRSQSYSHYSSHSHQQIPVYCHIFNL